MQTIEYLQRDLKWAHELLEMVMADVTEAQLYWTPPGLANPLGATFAHAICEEDAVVQGILRGEPLLYSSEWKGKTGISKPQMSSALEWARELKIDLPLAREYAKAVYAASEGHLKEMTEIDLDREIDLTENGFGVRNVAWVYSSLVISHLNCMSGEISCLKGMQGAKGYPF
jgi:hypothetical protein